MSTQNEMDPFVVHYDLDEAMTQTLKVRGAIRLLRAWASREGHDEIVATAQEALVASDKLHAAVKEAMR